MPNIRGTLSNIAKLDSTLVTQLPSVLPNASVLVDGETLNQKAITDELNAEIAQIAVVTKLGNEYHQAVADLNAMRPRGTKVRAAVRNLAAATVGENTPKYLSLGFPSRKVKTPTVATKQSGVVKRAETRIARNTMGKKQKAAIHGGGATPAKPQPAPPAAAATPSATTK